MSHLSSNLNNTSNLEEIFLFLDHLNKNNNIIKEEGEKGFILLIEADTICQGNDGNMDSILRLWKYYLPLLKKINIITKDITYRLYDSLNTYVSQGLQSLITTTNTNTTSNTSSTSNNNSNNSNNNNQQQQQQQQMIMKLQLLNFFLQRLCATLIYLGNHFKNEQFAQCFLHLYCFQGYIISQQNSAVDGYEAKIRELYQRFFESNFLTTLGPDRLLGILTSTAMILQNNPVRGVCGIGTWIGTIRCISIDLEIIIESNDFSNSYFTIISFIEIYFRSIECLTFYQRGSITDNHLIQYIKDLGKIVTRCLEKFSQISQIGYSQILKYILCRCICIPYNISLSSNILIVEEVKAFWSRMLLCTIFSLSNLFQEPIIILLITLLRSSCNISTIQQQQQQSPPQLQQSNLRSVNSCYVLGSCRARNLALTYRSIFLLSTSMKKQEFIERLIREVHEILNRPKSDNLQTEIEIVLCWIVSTIKLPNNELSVSFSIYNHALSQLSYYYTDSGTDLFSDTKYRILGRCNSLLSSLIIPRDIDIINHLQRSFIPEKQLVIYESIWSEIKLFLRYYDTSMSHLNKLQLNRKRNVNGNSITENISSQIAVYIGKVFKVGYFLIFLSQTQRNLLLLSLTQNNIKLMEKLKISNFELLQVSMDILNRIVQSLSKFFLDQNFTTNTSIEFRSTENLLFHTTNYLIRLVCVFLDSCSLLISSEAEILSLSNNLSKLFQNIQNIHKFPNISQYQINITLLLSHFLNLTSVINERVSTSRFKTNFLQTLPVEFQQVFMIRESQSLSSEVSWNISYHLTHEKLNEYCHDDILHL